MQKRQLGGSGLTLPALVLGGMFRETETRAAEIERVLDAALDHGICAIDTAPLYDFGAAESLLGRWRKRRGVQDEVLLLGKVGLRWDDAVGDLLFEAKDAAGRLRSVRKDSRPEAVRWDVEQSLTRLGAERLDLVQIHQRDPRTPLSETFGELMRLREEGKLRAIGVSNFEIADWQEAGRALSDLGQLSIQAPFSMIDRRAEAEGLSWARDVSAGFLAYSPMARGLLVGRGAEGAAPIEDSRTQDPMFRPGNRSRVNGAVDDVLIPMAESYGVSLSALALAWVIGQPGVTSALVGAQTEAQLEDAVAAGTLELAAADRSRLDGLSARIAIDRLEGRSVAERARGSFRRLVRRLIVRGRLG
ncbi:MAG: aldo/keto reductase [Myxococcota bacterium]